MVQARLEGQAQEASKRAAPTLATASACAAIAATSCCSSGGSAGLGRPPSPLRLLPRPLRCSSARPAAASAASSSGSLPPLDSPASNSAPAELLGELPPLPPPSDPESGWLKCTLRGRRALSALRALWGRLGRLGERRPGGERAGACLGGDTRQQGLRSCQHWASSLAAGRITVQRQCARSASRCHASVERTAETAEPCPAHPWPCIQSSRVSSPASNSRRLCCCACCAAAGAEAAAAAITERLWLERERLQRRAAGQARRAQRSSSVLLEGSR